MSDLSGEQRLAHLCQESPETRAVTQSTWVMHALRAGRGAHSLVRTFVRGQTQTALQFEYVAPFVVAMPVEKNRGVCVCVCVCVFVCVCVRACDRMLPRTCVYSHSLRPPEVCATRSLCHQKSVRVHAGKNLIRRPCRARQPQRCGRGS